jgi:hypothetical protein
MKGRGHLAPEVLIDLVDGRGAAEALRHVEACVSCREAVDELRATLSQTCRVEVPEPSPLFWDHFSTRVREAIDDEASARPQARRAGRLWWFVVPAGALAVLFAVGTVVLRQTPLTPVGSRVAVSEASLPSAGASAADALPDDNLWTFVATLSDELAADDDQAETVMPALGTAERAVDELSAEERGELVRLLEAELAKRRS